MSIRFYYRFKSKVNKKKFTGISSHSFHYRNGSQREMWCSTDLIIKKEKSYKHPAWMKIYEKKHSNQNQTLLSKML